jgi:hypothetical protein
MLELQFLGFLVAVRTRVQKFYISEEGRILTSLGPRKNRNH